jgi:hypothetical protein
MLPLTARVGRIFMAKVEPLVSHHHLEFGAFRPSIFNTAQFHGMISAFKISDLQLSAYSKARRPPEVNEWRLVMLFHALSSNLAHSPLRQAAIVLAYRFIEPFYWN